MSSQKTQEVYNFQIDLFRERVDTIVRNFLHKPTDGLSSILRDLTINILPSLRAHSGRYLFTEQQNVALVLRRDFTFSYPRNKGEQDSIAVKSANILKQLNRHFSGELIIDSDLSCVFCLIGEYFDPNLQNILIKSESRNTGAVDSSIQEDT